MRLLRKYLRSLIALAFSLGLFGLCLVFIDILKTLGASAFSLSWERYVSLFTACCLPFTVVLGNDIKNVALPDVAGQEEKPLALAYAFRGRLKARREKVKEVLKEAADYSLFANRQFYLAIEEDGYLEYDVDSRESLGLAKKAAKCPCKALVSIELEDMGEETAISIESRSDNPLSFYGNWMNKEHVKVFLDGLLEKRLVCEARSLSDL